MTRRWPWGAALAALAVVAAVFGPAIASGLFWAPGDGITQNFPVRVLVAAALRQGLLPFWNPFVFGGMPLLATIQPGVFFPGNWPFLVLPPVAAMDLALVGAYAGVFASTWCFARVLGLSTPAAWVAGAVYALGGFMLLHAAHIQMVQACALLPLLLAALERLAATGRRAYALAMAALVALVVLAGHPQTAAYGLAVAGAYALWRTVGLPRERRVGFLAASALALGLGVGLTLCQLLPTLDLIRASQRRAIDYDWLTIASVPPRGLLLWLFPFAAGVWSPSALAPTLVWGDRAWLFALEGYVGVVPLWLAGVGLARWRVEPAVRFWAGVALVGAVLSLGRYTPVYRLWALLPVFSQMPYANRHGLELTLALALLAAYGLDAITRELPPPLAGQDPRLAARVAGGLLGGVLVLVLGWVAIAGPGFAARTQPLVPAGIDVHAALSLGQAAFWLPLLWLVLALGLSRRESLARWGLPLLIAIDLWSFNRHQGLGFVLPHVPTDLVVNPSIDWSKGRSLGVSVERYPNCYHCDILAHLRRWHYPDVSMLSGEPTINGYDAFLPARYGQLLGMDSFGHAGEKDPSIWEANHHALDLLGLVTLRLAPELAKSPDWQRRLASGRWVRQPDEGGLVVLANTRALPHAWRVSRVRVLPAEVVDAAVRGQSAFTPLDEALVESPVEVSPSPGRVAVTSPSLNRMRLETDGAGPGLVVVSSGYDPGWRAWDERGNELAVCRTDALLTGVTVPAGKQTVTLAYEPPRWRTGLATFVLSLLLLLAWGLRPRRPGIR